MIDQHDMLLKFRDALISKEELQKNVGHDLVSQKIDTPIEIRIEHLLNVIKKFQKNEMNKQQLLDWVNAIWFTELYEYCDEHVDSIASVMNELEEIDEDENKASSDNIERYIKALENNTEVRI